MQYSKRDYRRGLCPAGMDFFTVTVKETDLWIAVDKDASNPDLPGQVEQYVWQKRRSLEKYIERDPLFKSSLQPYLVSADAPPMAVEMARAGNLAGVGPMAAVAGAFAQYTGLWLQRVSDRVIVENGGDIFLFSPEPVRVGIFAGQSPFSGKLFLEVKSHSRPRGICTSSSSVGPSFSEGRADAAVVLASDAMVADAVATAAANRVRSAKDLPGALQYAQEIPGVEGALLIIGKKLVAWGDIQLLS